MSTWKNEAEARRQIKEMVTEYYHDFKEKKTAFKPGDRISYADIYDKFDDDIRVYTALLNSYNTNLDITYKYAMKAKNGL